VFGPVTTFLDGLNAVRDFVHGSRDFGEIRRTRIRLVWSGLVNELAFSPNARYLAIGTGWWSKGESHPGNLVLCSIEKQRPVKVLYERPLKVLTLAFSLTGRFLAYGTGGVERDRQGIIKQRMGRVKILQFGSRYVLQESGDLGLVRKVVISPDEKMLACYASGRLHILDASSLEQIHRGPRNTCVNEIRREPVSSLCGLESH